MENLEIGELEARLYDIQTKLTVCLYVLTPGNVFEEDDIHGLGCILCECIGEIEEISKELTDNRKPTDSPLVSPAKIVKFPKNTQPAISAEEYFKKFPFKNNGKNETQERQPEPEAA